jgi:hypothetical protein
MELGLWNYAIFMPVENSCIKFNNNKIDILQTYKIAEFYTVWFSVWPNIISKFQTTTRSVKENKDSNKTYRYIHDLTPHTTLFVLSPMDNELSSSNKM